MGGVLGACVRSLSSITALHLVREGTMAVQTERNVIIAALVVTSLGLGLGLGLRSSPNSQVSCRNRCQDKATGEPGDCQCDSQCAAKGTCCWDFDDICLKPTNIWACNRLRCGEKRRSDFLCSCSDDCLKTQDCCTNYNSVCKGETAWAADKCGSMPDPQCPKGFTLPPVILFSLDGFRAEYLQTWGGLMPNIEKLKTCGTHSKYMRAAYPTKTFPNHYTIVTGLYPESNGIIDNSMYDVHLNKSFSLSGNEKFNETWWKGQPIWLTAMYHNLKAGTYFWPGSDVKINGSYPTLYKMFNKSAIYEERVSTILQWLDLPPAKRPDFYTLYIEEPDTSGHSFGPVSGGVIKALMLADWTIGMLMDGLKQRKLHNCVNLILLADHGMDKTYCEQLEYMTNYFSNINSFYMYDGPAARIRARNVPKEYFTFDSAGVVKNLTCRRPSQHFKPYLTPDLPKRFHYANNIRIDKVHLYVDKQWLAVRDKSYTFCGGGNHGYDNEFKSMAAIFIGHGPGFKDGVEVEAFENIEVYNLMCDLLKITPAPNNGTHGSLNHLLRKPVYIPSHPKEVSPTANCRFPNPIPGDTSGCTCNLDNATIAKLRRLDLTTEEMSRSEKLNLPYGRPRVLQKISTYCLLHQHDYVSGYSHDILMPLWTAYTVDKTGASSPPPTLSHCLRADARIPEAKSQKCSDYNKTDLNITHDFLFPPNFNRTAAGQYDGLITSNFIPMYEEFKKIWHYLHDVLLLQYAVERNGLNVISGPVFDYNYDGHFDTVNETVRHVHGTGIPIPTHFFVVITSCKNTTYSPLHCLGSLDVLSFIIPHRPDNSESCADGKPASHWVEERLKMHSARVRDVELLTGLDFYQDRNQPLADILQLKTFLPTFDILVN